MVGGDDHAKGLAITVIGVLIFSPDALLIRLTAIDDLSLAVHRGILAGFVTLAICIVRYRKDFLRQILRSGVWGPVIAFLYGGSNIVFYAALERTSVANVLVIFAVTPLIAAAMGRVFLREDVSLETGLAMLAAASGIAIVGSGGLTSGHWAGDFLALLDAVSIAAIYTIVRQHREVNMLPAVGIGMMLSAAMAYPFAEFSSMGPLQWLWIVLGGALVLPAAIMLLTLGPRYLPAPEVAMIALLETALGPTWVWLVLGEYPGTRTVFGGGVVVTALFIHALLRLRYAAKSSSA